MGKRQDICDAIYQVLRVDERPCETRQDLAHWVSKKLKDTINEGQISWALEFNKKQSRGPSPHMRWRVVRARMGRAIDTGESRYYIIRLDNKGNPKLEPGREREFHSATRGACKEAESKARNFAADLELVLPFFKSPTEREYLEAVLEDQAYVAKKLRRIVARVLKHVA